MVFMGKIGWKIPYSQYMSIYHTPPDGFWSGKWCKNAIIVAPWLGSPCQVAGRQLLQNSLCPKINHLLADPYGSTDGLPVRKRKKNRPHHRKKGLVRWYPLVIWKITIFTGKTHYKWQLSIAMLVITRGYMMILHPQESVIKKLKTSWKKKKQPKTFLISPSCAAGATELIFKICGVAQETWVRGSPPWIHSFPTSLTCLCWPAETKKGRDMLQTPSTSG